MISGLVSDCSYAAILRIFILHVYRRGGLYLGTTAGEDRGDSTGVFEPSLEGDSDSDTEHTGVCHTGGYKGVHT